MERARLGVDVGGTFTDLVALVGGALVTAKTPSTPADQARGVLRAVTAADLDAGSVGVFAHGSTVATNALLERRGARTALVTTEGFRDVIEIGRQNRPALYDLTRDRPAALVPGTCGSPYENGRALAVLSRRWTRSRCTPPCACAGRPVSRRWLSGQHPTSR